MGRRIGDRLFGMSSDGRTIVIIIIYELRTRQNQTNQYVEVCS